MGRRTLVWLDYYSVHCVWSRGGGGFCSLGLGKAPLALKMPVACVGSFVVKEREIEKISVD